MDIYEALLKHVKRIESLVKDHTNPSEDRLLEVVNLTRQLIGENKRYRDTLEWYADHYNYHIPDELGYLAVQNDDGERARNALRPKAIVPTE